LQTLFLTGGRLCSGEVVLITGGTAENEPLCFLLSFLLHFSFLKAVWERCLLDGNQVLSR